MQWSYGFGGWVRFDFSDWAGPAYVRFQPLDDGGLVVTELYLDSRGVGVRAADLARLDLDRLTHLARSGWAEGGAPFVDAAGPDLSRLASHWRTNFGSQARHWVADSMRAQRKGSDVRQAPFGRDVRVDSRLGAAGETRPLYRPPTGTWRLPDSFLRDVAVAYRQAVGRGLRPAPELARQAGLGSDDVRLVHKWIAKARDRGFLDRGQQGKAGG